MRIPAARIHFHADDRGEILRKIDEVLSNGQLTLGKYGRELEERFAAYVGTKYAVAVNSGTSSISVTTLKNARKLGIL